jgi:hypothetical protein
MINGTFKRLKKENDINEMKEKVLRVRENKGKINQKVNKLLP